MLHRTMCNHYAYIGRGGLGIRCCQPPWRDRGDGGMQTKVSLSGGLICADADLLRIMQIIN